MSDMDYDTWRPAPDYPDGWHVIEREDHFEEGCSRPYMADVRVVKILTDRRRIAVFRADFWHVSPFIGGHQDEGWQVDPESGAGLSFDEIAVVSALIGAATPTTPKGDEE